MADCPTCINKCAHRWCVDMLLCAFDCCGCCHLLGVFVEDADIPAGTLLGERNDKRLGPFDPLATDGLQNFMGIAMHHITTDENGEVLPRVYNPYTPSANCGPLYDNFYVCGIFFENQLFGDVDAAIAAGGLRRVHGGLVKLI